MWHIVVVAIIGIVLVIFLVPMLLQKTKIVEVPQIIPTPSLPQLPTEFKISLPPINIEGATDLIKSAGETIKETITETVTETVTETITETIETVKESGKEIIYKVVDKTKPIVEEISGITEEEARKAQETGTEAQLALSSAWDKAVETFTGYEPEQITQSLTGLGEAIDKNITQPLTGLGEAIDKNITQPLTGLGEEITEPVSTVGAKLRQRWAR